MPFPDCFDISIYFHLYHPKSSVLYCNQVFKIDKIDIKKRNKVKNKSPNLHITYCFFQSFFCVMLFMCFEFIMYGCE